MFIHKKWKLTVHIFLLSFSCAICHSQLTESSNAEVSANTDDYVDPHSFYYDKHTKKEVKMQLQESMSDTSIMEFSPYRECTRSFNDCVNRKQKEIPDELFSRRLVNILLNLARFEENDDSLLIGNIVMEVSSAELIKLKDFGIGKATIRDIDSIISNIFKSHEKYIFQDTFSSIKYLCMDAFMHKDIVLGSLVVLFMTRIILTTKWSMFKLMGMAMMIVLAISFIITWLQLLKQAEVKHTVKQMVHTKIPVHCRPHDMSLWDKIRTTFSTLESCEEYYEAMIENPFLHVTPVQAFSHMIAKSIAQPAKAFGDALGDFVHQATKHLWFASVFEPLLMFATLLLAIVAIVCVAGGSFAWGFGPLSKFSLRGSNQSTNNRRTNTEEIREPVQVMVNFHMSHNNGTHQLGERIPEQENITSIMSTEDKIPKRESIKDTGALSKPGKLDLDINPASGDSNSFSISSQSKDNEDTTTDESKVDEIVAKSGSGDN